MISMSFSPTTTHKLVIVEAVHYSNINHYQLLKTLLNRFQKSFLVVTPSTEIKYHQQIEFLIKLQQHYIVSMYCTISRVVQCHNLAYFVLYNTRKILLHKKIHWNLFKTASKVKSLKLFYINKKTDFTGKRFCV